MRTLILTVALLALCGCGRETTPVAPTVTDALMASAVWDQWTMTISRESCEESIVEAEFLLVPGEILKRGDFYLCLNTFIDGYCAETAKFSSYDITYLGDEWWRVRWSIPHDALSSRPPRATWEGCMMNLACLLPGFGGVGHSYGGYQDIVEFREPPCRGCGCGIGHVSDRPPHPQSAGYQPRTPRAGLR